MLQFPALKPGVMVVLLGKQGTGKGLFFEILHRIWPKTYLLVSDINQVLGQFNAALERNYVIVMDEAMFSGDRKSQDRLKSLITENTCHIEQKYQPSRTIESVHRFFASSNHSNFSNV
jgi:phage/plasmid-associated DNA primase